MSAAAEVEGWTSSAADVEDWTSDAAEVEGWISADVYCISVDCVDVEGGIRISGLINFDFGMRLISIFDLFLRGSCCGIGCSSGIGLFFRCRFRYFLLWKFGNRLLGFC